MKCKYCGSKNIEVTDTFNVWICNDCESIIDLTSCSKQDTGDFNLSPGFLIYTYHNKILNIILNNEDLKILSNYGEMKIGNVCSKCNKIALNDSQHKYGNTILCEECNNEYFD